MTSIREAGVRVVCGTDAGIGPPKPHGILPLAGQMLIDLGFEPVEALRSMTSSAAQACRVARRKGRIAPGLDADLLAVHGDPLIDISALQKPAAIFRLGHRLPAEIG
jgi:imidazolonepropionase-like amidohydrolase